MNENKKDGLETTLEGVDSAVNLDEDEEQRRARIIGEGAEENVQEASAEEADKPAFTVRYDNESEGGRFDQLKEKVSDAFAGLKEKAGEIQEAMSTQGAALKEKLSEKAEALCEKASHLKDKAAEALSDLKDKAASKLQSEPEPEKK